MLFVQIVGRGLRTAEGKSDCLILDHSDNHVRLGFVTDIHHESLDRGSARKAAKTRAASLPKPCPSCTFLKPPRVHQCPSCGFKPVAQAAVHCYDGELVEITPGATTAPDRVDRLEFWAGLRYYAVQRGYARGWAAHKYREKFGAWPNGLDFVAPSPPSTAMASWIRSRQIAFARRRGAA